MKVSTDLRQQDEKESSWSLAEQDLFTNTQTSRGTDVQPDPLDMLTVSERKGFTAALEYLVHTKQLEGVALVADLVAKDYAEQVIKARTSPLYSEELILKEGIVLAKCLLASAATHYLQLLQKS
jgi:hypothetical protein